MVAMNSIPTALRTPFVTAEFDNSRAAQGPSALPYRGFLIGQKTAAGTGTADTLYKVTNADQVRILGGPGSQIHRQAIGWFAANKATELWIGLLADAGGGIAATKTITITGPATAAGTLALYLGGVSVPVGVAAADTATAIGTAAAAAINLLTDLPVTASAAVGVVTLTQKNKGLVGIEYDVRVNYRSDSEALPAGLAVVVAAAVAGTTPPTLTNLIAAMGDTWFHVIAHPFTDATSLTALENEMVSRFGPMRLIDGVMITAKDATLGAIGTLGLTRNCPHSLIVRTNNSPIPPAEYAAHAAGVVALNGQIDPARPMQTLPLPFILPPAEIDVDSQQERNILLYQGISTTRVNAGGQVVIDRMITTYQTNAAGSADVSYLDVTSLLSLMYARYNWRNRIASRYPRHKLGDDGVQYPSGEAVMTPSLGRAEAVAWFMDMSTTSPVVFDPSSLAQFKRDLIVVRNADVNRLDFLLPPDLINQLIVAAAKIQFIL